MRKKAQKWFFLYGQKTQFLNRPDPYVSAGECEERAIIER